MADFLLWQQSLELLDDFFDPNKIATDLHQCSRQLFLGVLKDPAHESHHAFLQGLRHQAQRFSLWGSSFEAQGGGLDERLVGADQLKETLLPLLGSMGDALVIIAQHLSRGRDLAELCSRARSLKGHIADVTRKPGPSGFNGGNELLPAELLDQLDSSDSEDSTSNEAAELEGLLQDIQSYNACLLGLSSVLQEPAESVSVDLVKSKEEITIVRANAGRLKYFAVASTFFTATPSGHSERNQTLNTPDLGLVAPESRKVGTQLPELSVVEGHSLIRRGQRFPREDLFMGLKARDHAFLVDNAESIQPYRNEVNMVLELLWAMIMMHDPDGPDLYITTDMKPLKPRTDLQMLQELASRPAKDAPDIRLCFAQIIKNHQTKCETSSFESRWRPWRIKRPRKLSLYVLTDGVWHTKTDLRQEIRTLVANLSEHKLTNKNIGIQFIRFGNDGRGMKRLEKLDSGLNLDLDAVDTTPANGNVWKMLLGAVNEWFDDDPNDEENELESEILKVWPSNVASPPAPGTGSPSHPFWFLNYPDSGELWKQSSNLSK